MAIVMKAGDTAPAVRVTLLDAAGDPVNLDDQPDVRFIVATRTQPRTVIVDQPATVHPGGEVTYAWQPGDTDQPGRYLAEFEVVYSDGTIQSFPTDGYIDCRIVDDLGGIA